MQERYLALINSLVWSGVTVFALNLFYNGEPAQRALPPGQIGPAAIFMTFAMLFAVNLIELAVKATGFRMICNAVNAFFGATMSGYALLFGIDRRIEVSPGTTSSALMLLIAAALFAWNMHAYWYARKGLPA